LSLDFDGMSSFPVSRFSAAITMPSVQTIPSALALLLIASIAYST